MDITQSILEDHHGQRRAFARLDEVDRGDTERLRLLWSDLAQFLEVHAAAEEAVFYPELLRRADENGSETKDAIGDHNDIRNAVREAGRQAVGSDAWWASVDKARRANTEHMGEEEDDGLADFRKHASLEVRHNLAVLFDSAKTRPAAGALDYADKDPDGYVAEHS